MQVTNHPQLIGVIGGSKLNVSVTIPGLLDCNLVPVIITRDETRFSTSPIKVQIGEKQQEYTLLPYTEDDYREWDAKSNTAFHINPKSPYYNAFIKSTKMFISAAREGIIYYADSIESIKGDDKATTYVISIDNDATPLITAMNACKNSNIVFCTGMVHGTVPRMDITQNVIILPTRNASTIILPPAAAQFYSEFFNKSPSEIESNVSIVCAKNDGELRYFKRWKLLTINAIHTGLCIYATQKGISEGMSMAQIQDMPLGYFYNDLEDILAIAFRMFITYYYILAKELSEVQEYVDDFMLKDYMVYDKDVLSTLLFVRQLYDDKDMIKRGLNINDTASVTSKLERHLAPLKEEMSIYSDDALHVKSMLKVFKWNGIKHDITNEEIVDAICIAKDLIKSSSLYDM